MFWLILPFLVVALPSLLFYSFSTDEYTYMNTAKSFAAGEFHDVEDPARFPLFSVALAIAFKLFGASELISKLVPILFGLLSVLLVFKLGEKSLGRQKGFWAALVFSSVPFFSFLSTRVLSESLFVFLAVACVYVLRKIAVENQSSSKNWFLMGALFALLFLARYNGLALALAVPVVLWKFGKLKLVWGRQALFGAAGFVLVLSPWLYYSHSITGSPVGLFLQFTAGQVHLGQKLFMTLPDRIPTIGELPSIPGTTLLATLAVLGLPLLLLAWILFKQNSVKGSGLRKFMGSWLGEKNNFVFAAAALSVAIGGELIGLLHPSLLRYVVPAAPFLCLLLADAVFGNNFDGKNVVKKSLAAAIFLNVLAGLLLVSLFTPYAPVKTVSYEKHSLHREVGLLSATGCQSVYSNIPGVMLFYSSRKNTPLSGGPQCIALSNFEGDVENFQVPPGYDTVFNKSGVRFYRKT